MIGVIVAGAVLALLGLAAWSSLATALNNLGKESAVEPIPSQATPQDFASPLPSDNPSQNAIEMIKERTDIINTLGGN